MTFAELVAEAILWSKRPDLVNATHSAIRRNTLKFHRREKFWKDVTYLSITNPTPTEGVISLDIPTFFPRYRQFLSIKINGCKLDPLVMDDLIDLDGYAKKNVYLLAGTNLNIKYGAGFPTLDVGYYQDPIVAEDTYTSWIANEYPDLIAAGAAADLLAFDNESEIYKAAKQEANEQWATLVMNNLEVEAR